MKTRPETAAFSILEILTVMAVIVILAGMTFPILNRARAAAQNAAGSDLCAQVASAWNMLLVDNRRFPSEDLVKACVDAEANYGGIKNVGGDLVFRMSPGAGSLLNWWKRRSPIPAADRKNFTPHYENGSKKGSDIPLKPGDDGAFVENWPADTYFERDVAHKRLGVFGPWIAVPKGGIVVEDAENGEKKRYPLVSCPHEKLVSWLEENSGFSVSDIVIVSLDMDGDGQVPVEVALSGDGAVEADEAKTIPASSAAWIWRKEKRGRKLLKSW